MAHEHAGQLAKPSDLIDIASLVSAYYTRKPQVDDPDQAVSFGTSGHRGSSLTVRLMTTRFWRLPKLSWITALRRAPRVLFLLVGIRTRSQNLRWSPPLKCCWPMTWKYAWIIMAAIRQLQLSPMRF